MTPTFQTPHVTVYTGDALAVLRELPDGSVDCCVTSPPYWGLRDYGVVGQLGLEPTPAEYVQKMVGVFREVRRVLAKHGTLWLNLGDSYNAYPGGAGPGSKLSQTASEQRPHLPTGYGLRYAGLKPKDLVGIPWRVAFALQADGWYLRSDIIWAKPNPMPESVTDRPTKSHEYVFLLSKSERYFYDSDAIKEPMKMVSLKRLSQPNVFTQPGGPKDSGEGNRSERKAINNQAERLIKHEKWKTRFEGWDQYDKSLGRNARTVWEIATQPYPDAHFATFPRDLPERCIKAGCPESVCASCGKARERIVEKGESDYARIKGERSWRDMDADGLARGVIVRPGEGGQTRTENGTVPSLKAAPRTEIGLTDCGHNAYRPGTVLDPFAGSGTTLAVARDLGRKSIGIELNPTYVALIEKRCAQLAMDMPA